MLEVGRLNRLPISRIIDTGAMLATDQGDILLPTRYIPAGAATGDVLEVFVYRDSKDRLVATTQTPKAMVGEFALLTVKEVGQFGTFLDWGLDKDLLVPFAEQPVRMRLGEKHLVRVYVDNTGRLAASARLDTILEQTNETLQEGEEVDLIVYAFTDLGAKVIINNRYSGLLFKNELYGKPQRGERLKGYVKRIRDDRKIDVTLKKGGAQEVASDMDTVLKSLARNDGFLPLNDKSPPEAIAGALRMSKKSFKKAVGGLYKDGVVEITDSGIRLRQKKGESSV